MSDSKHITLYDKVVAYNGVITLHKGDRLRVDIPVSKVNHISCSWNIDRQDCYNYLIEIDTDGGFFFVSPKDDQWYHLLIDYLKQYYLMISTK